MEVVKKPTKETGTVKYDPNKRYTWTPSDKFELTGEQFGIILNTFRRVLSSPVADMIFRIDEANREIEKLMADAVEKGIIKEAAPSPEE